MVNLSSVNTMSNQEQPRAVIIHPSDTLATLVVAAEGGATILVTGAGESLQVKANGDIPAGHKVALRDIAQGELVHKYGQPIGKATQQIKCGDLVHSHNLVGMRGRADVLKE